MEFNIWSFVLENLDASGGIGGYVSISIVGFALISFAAKKNLKNGLKPLKFKWTHSAIGSLRGHKDTFGPMVNFIISYWFIAIPAGKELPADRNLPVPLAVFP